MSDKIRIQSIELENYRQYYGNQKIIFSSRSEGFTIIAGKNGEGKSNLLNAISWCLYHDEPHGINKSMNKSLSIINNRYVTELEEGKQGRVSVKILLKSGDKTYSISRVLTIIRHELEYQTLHDGTRSLMLTEHADERIPRRCEIIPSLCGFMIKKKGSDDSDFCDTGYDSCVIMEEILPEQLSKYFLLDGEFLEGFWQDISTIQTGIEQISQLHLLKNLEEHLNSMLIPTKGAGRDPDKISDQIDHLQHQMESLDEMGNERWSKESRWKQDPDEEDGYYHATGRPRMKELNEDIKKMEKRRDAIIRQIKDSPGGITQLKEEKVDCEEELKLVKERLEKHRKNYNYNLITKSPYVFLKRAIEKSVEIIEARMEAGDLPVEHRRQFAEDLLKNGICICGENLSKDSNGANRRRANVEKFKDSTKGKNDLDSAVGMKFHYRDIIDNYQRFLQDNFGSHRDSFRHDEDAYKRLSTRIKVINTQLRNSGGDEAERLIAEQQYLDKETNRKRSELQDIERDMTGISKELQILRVEYDKVVKKDKKLKKLQHQRERWDQIQKHVRKAYDELKEEIRIEVQNNTWNNFREMLANPTEFKNFTIESDYKVYLVDNNDINKIYNLSAGQSLILTLAFVAALRKSTGYGFPLVVDSPLGKIDGGNRYNIGMQLPGYLPEEQLTLLVTDTEYTANIPFDPEHPERPTTPFAKLLESTTRLKHFKIHKERNKKDPNMGNSTIKDAKLVEDKDRNGWMLEYV